MNQPAGRAKGDRTEPIGRDECSRAVLASIPVTRSDTHAAIAFGALSAWLGMLFIGWTLGGAIHLLLALALALFPWRRLGG